MTESRKLAAILAADVVGYSRLASADEDRTLARLRALRSDLIDPTIAVHNGRVVKRTGDGILVEFRSVVDAIRCAVEVQNAMVERNAGLPPDRRIEFRIGIHLGDVVEESDGDLMGDGVNIAARLEGIAAPGAICLSEDAYRQVKARLDLLVSDLGPTLLKNITEPVRIYSLEVGGRGDGKGPAAGGVVRPNSSGLPLALPDKPSIAVLPFTNMSGNPEQEYFADGIVDDIITALSRFNQLFVIARNSSFTYKGRAVDVKQVGRELGVRYVLEGSVRKAGAKVRIVGQLINTETGAHLWANKFDGELEDIFDLQDRVTESVVGAIAPRLEKAEIERAQRKPTESLDAYDYYLRGLSIANQMTRAANDEALHFFNAAIARDPDFWLAFARASYCYAHRKANGWMSNRTLEIADAERLARHAIEGERDDALVLCYGGLTLSYVVGAFDDGAASIGRALALNVNLADAWAASAFVKLCTGEPDVAIQHSEHAMRLSPFDPNSFMWLTDIALAHLLAGRHDISVIWAEKALHEQPNFAYSARVAAASHAFAGHSAEARKAIMRLHQLDPQLRLSNLDNVMSPLRPEDRAKYREGLRRAGLSE